MPPPPLLLRHLLRPHLLRPAPLLAVRSFSAAPAPVSALAQSLSSALHDLRSSADPLPERLSLLFPSLRPSTSLLSDVLRLSPPPPSALPLFRWLVLRRRFHPSDQSLSLLVAFLGRHHLFPSLHLALLEFRRAIGTLTLHETLDRLVRAGRATDAAQFFRLMRQRYGVRQDSASLAAVVSALASHGHGRIAEELVREWSDRIFPDDNIRHLVVTAWCVGGRPDEAIRLISEMRRGGFEPRAPTYNALLDSVCRLARKKDPLTMKDEAEKVLVEMEVCGVPRDVGTFRVLVVNLCKIRKTEDAMKVFDRMGDCGCVPDAEIYLTLIRSLYQAARLSEGEGMIARMWSAGFKKELDVKECYGFLKILCGIERMEHALKVFRMLKRYAFKPGVQTYELLMERLCAHNHVEQANALFRQATAMGLPMSKKEYKVDPKYAKKPEKEKGTEKKKRLTMPEKILMRRRRLKKLRLSFVKKPRKRRAY